MSRTTTAALAPVVAMAVATPVLAAPVQPTPSLWHLGIEAQELTSRIAHLADQLGLDDPEQQQAAIASLEEALLSEEGNHQH